MRAWVLTVLALLVLGALGYWAESWVRPLLSFVGAESDTLGGLASLVQLLLWLGAGAILIVRLMRGLRSDTAEGRSLSAEARDRAVIAQDRSTAGGVLGIGGDVHGDVIVATDAAELWGRIGRKLPAEDLRRATESYLGFLIERYRSLDFKGMGMSDRVPLRLPLLEMYVPLKARVEMPEGETWTRLLKLAGRAPSREEEEVLGERVSGPQPVLELLGKNDGLVILGDPGAGKTTFLKYLTLSLAGDRGEALGLGARLPFLVPLSAYATATAEEDVPLDRFIARYAEGRGLDLPLVPMLEKALGEGGALILLDGLDEVRELERRSLVVSRVEDFYARHRERGSKFVLTSRVVGYREVRLSAEGLAECTLVDFDREEIESFVGKWTAAVERGVSGAGRVAAQDAEREREELLEAIYTHPGVEALAANPLLLTILAVMKRQGVDLPERRVELYQKYVETLLKHWNLARSLDGRSGRSLDVLETLRLLAPLALWMHRVAPGVGLVKEVELSDELKRIFRERGEPDAEQAASAASRFMSDLREHAGLLLDRGGRQFGFIHLTFQEYLAAWALAAQAQQDVTPLAEVLCEHLGEPEWREVSLLAVGCLGVIQQRDLAASEVLERLLSRAPGEPGEAVILAGEAVADVGAVGVSPQCRERVVGEVLGILRRWEEVPAPRRAEAGKVLARLGDPRFSSEHWSLPAEPLLGFVEVPAGRFLMGSDKKKDEQAYDDELPQHELELPGYFIGRYPVTVGQFRAFVESSGYEPGGRVSLRGVANVPVTDVSWHDAQAYCAWLGERLGEKAAGRLEAVEEETARRFWGGLARSEVGVGLPSEAEWEKAARGGDGRVYPWGDEHDPNRANYYETKIGEVSPVGCFPGGRSPYGCEEMSGNVWEWTRSLWGKESEKPEFGYPYDPLDDRESLEASADVRRVLRGGAFNDNQRHVRCAIRNRLRPYFRYGNFGFRVLLSPFL